MVKKLRINESNTVGYKQDIDNLTTSLMTCLKDTVNTLNLIRYSFDDEEGITDTNFDKISNEEYEDMISKLKDYKQYANYMQLQISKMNKRFDDVIG